MLFVHLEEMRGVIGERSGNDEFALAVAEVLNASLPSFNCGGVQWACRFILQSTGAL